MTSPSYHILYCIFPGYFTALSWFPIFLPSGSFFLLFVFPLVAMSFLGYLLRHILFFYCHLLIVIFCPAMSSPGFIVLCAGVPEMWMLKCCFHTGFFVLVIGIGSFFWRTSCFLVCEGKECLLNIGSFFLLPPNFLSLLVVCLWVLGFVLFFLIFHYLLKHIFLSFSNDFVHQESLHLF